MTIPAPETPDAVGVYPVDKPEGVTSFAVVRRIRRLLGIKKVGHAGTLDPFASGLLLVCAGREATRHVDALMAGRKSYTARIKLGVETDTLDPEGRVIAEAPVPAIDEAALRACLAALTGEIMQRPPIFSALKHEGKPLYRYAREGAPIEKPPRPVHIHSLDLLAWNADAHELDIAVTCGKGAYIRSLARDIGEKLGTRAHLTMLRRTAIGPFDVTEALDGQALFAEEDEEATAALLRSARVAVEDALTR